MCGCLLLAGVAVVGQVFGLLVSRFAGVLVGCVVGSLLAWFLAWLLACLVG